MSQFFLYIYVYVVKCKKKSQNLSKILIKYYIQSFSELAEPDATIEPDALKFQIKINIKFKITNLKKKYYIPEAFPEFLRDEDDGLL